MNYNESQVEENGSVRKKKRIIHVCNIIKIKSYDAVEKENERNFCLKSEFKEKNTKEVITLKLK